MELALHFLFWWVISVGFWTKGFGWNPWAILSLLAPIYFGIFYLWIGELWEIGICSILSFIALFLLTIIALRTRKTWIMLLAHLAVIVYWFFSFVLIAAGV